MNRNVAFTICAKNYLAQALSLRESYLKYNNTDFFIFLSDLADVEDLPDVVELDDSWIPDWRLMAFKYNVIEFSTSIKPFCIQKLFTEGYDRVMYLDPDIFVCNNLNLIFSYLDDKSIVMTPHRCKICQVDFFITSEQILSSVGVYNLGFFAVKNDEVGTKVIEWWENKLTHLCLADTSCGLFVDQKWMDFIPGYFPNETYISSHLGMNVAIWNLHEREVFERDASFYVKDKFGDSEYELLFFHFSGYNPNSPELLSKNIKKSAFVFTPALQILACKYRECEFENEYERYSKMKYSFNFFSNGAEISDFVRRLYYSNIDQLVPKGNPFDSNGFFYALLSKRNLLEHKEKSISSEWHIGSIKKKRLDYRFFNAILKTRGVKSYLKIISFMRYFSDRDYQKYLVE